MFISQATQDECSKGVDRTFFIKAAEKRSKPKIHKVYERKRRDSAIITLI